MENNLINQVEEKEEGAAMVEYALLVALIAVVALLAIGFLGEKVSAKFQSVGSYVGGTTTAGLPGAS